MFFLQNYCTIMNYYIINSKARSEKRVINDSNLFFNFIQTIISILKSLLMLKSQAHTLILYVFLRITIIHYRVTYMFKKQIIPNLFIPL